MSTDPSLVGPRSDVVRILALTAALLVTACDREQAPPLGTTDLSGPTGTAADPSQVEVPDLVGSSIDAARDLLRVTDLAFRVEKRSSNEPTGTVLKQTPRARQLVTAGSLVKLVVAKPRPNCLTAGEIREMLISRSNPDIYALYFDSGEVAAQGICCGPGYEVQAFYELGLGVVMPQRDTIGTDSYNIISDPGELDDTTFTRNQFLRYSRFEARRCRRSG